MSSSLRDITESTEAEGRDDTHQHVTSNTLITHHSSHITVNTHRTDTEMSSLNGLTLQTANTQRRVVIPVWIHPDPLDGNTDLCLSKGLTSRAPLTQSSPAADLRWGYPPPQARTGRGAAS